MMYLARSGQALEGQDFSSEFDCNGKPESVDDDRGKQIKKTKQTIKTETKNHSRRERETERDSKKNEQEVAS